MKRTPREIGLAALALVALVALGLAAGWAGMPWSPETEDPTRRWLLLTDKDGDGVLSPAEYAAVSDGVTPMSLIDIDGDNRLDAAEIHAFLLEADPIDWVLP